MPTESWLKCEVSEGMFPNERTIRIVLPNGESHYAFVPLYLIRMTKEPDQGLVKVTLWSHDGLWVLLPGENPNILVVREADLVA